MPTNIWIAIIIACFVGMLVNELINYILKTRGTLRIDHSNPNKDKYLFEIDEIETLNKKKYILLKIDNHADLSQK